MAVGVGVLAIVAENVMAHVVGHAASAAQEVVLVVLCFLFIVN